MIAIIETFDHRHGLPTQVSLQLDSNQAKLKLRRQYLVPDMILDRKVKITFNDPKLPTHNILS